MNQEQFDTLPYVSRKELVDLRDYFKSTFESTYHMINKVDVDSVLYEFKDKTNKYAFVVRNIKFDDTKKINKYNVYYRPENLSNINGTSVVNTFSQIKESFSRWIDNVRKMHEITHLYYNPDEKFYNEQFSDFFTNEDDDAAINPFEIEKQEVLFYFLTYAEKTVEKSTNLDDSKKIELVTEISELKENIPKLTKKRFVASLSKFAENTKKANNKLFHDIFDVLKKELIKKVLYKAAEEIPNVIHRIEGWINLLN